MPDLEKTLIIKAKAEFVCLGARWYQSVINDTARQLPHFVL